jgi:hypothetical protein
LTVYQQAADIDTDGDHLSDDDEVSVHGTDPMNPDTDEDGVNDGMEVAFGTNPNDPENFPSVPLLTHMGVVLIIIMLAFACIGLVLCRRALLARR